jgi:hypothetical protein
MLCTVMLSGLGHTVAGLGAAPVDRAASGSHAWAALDASRLPRPHATQTAQHLRASARSALVQPAASDGPALRPRLSPGSASRVLIG